MRHANVIASKLLQDEQVKAVGDLYARLSNSNYERVQRLLQSSFEIKDRLRAFLSAWTAFEVLVSMSFSKYEKKFFDDLLSAKSTGVMPVFSDRVLRPTIDKRYAIMTKFVMIACQVSSDTADTDTKCAEDAKDIRDKFAHGDVIDETALPLESIRTLAGKYLRLLCK